MKSSAVVVVLVFLATAGLFAHAAEKTSNPDVGKSSGNPSDLLVGKWQDNAEPDDAVIEFVKDGTGTITETTPTKTSQAIISWRIKQSFGNACVVIVEYQAPKPEGIKPFTWLIAFDGNDTYLTQPVQNKIVAMKRKK